MIKFAVDKVKSWFSENKGELPKIGGSRFENALKKAKESKDVGFFKKIFIFAKTFLTESGEVKKEKEAVKGEASKTVEQGVDATMADARKLINLENVKDEKDRQFYDEVLAMGVTSYEGMDQAHQVSASTALTKIDQVAEGKKPENFTFEESASLIAVGIKTLKQLKTKYPKKADFKAALDRIVKISDSSSYPFKKLLNSDTLKLFSVSSDEEGLKFLNAFGIQASAGDLFGSGDATKVKDLMTGLGKSPIQNKEGIVDFMKKHVFPTTDKRDITHVVGILNEMITGDGDKLSSDKLTDLTFYLHDNDYDHLITALVGKSNTSVAKLGQLAA